MGTVIQSMANGFLFGWTPEMEDQLRQFRDEGLSQNEIARRMRKSRTAINNKVQQMGLPKRESPIKLDRKIDDAVAGQRPKPERTDPLALLIRQATLPLPMPAPVAAPRTCQWPLWGNERPGLNPQFCGARPEVGRPYCCAHWQKAHTPRFSWA
jgi:hypothetical protein